MFYNLGLPLAVRERNCALKFSQEDYICRKITEIGPRPQIFYHGLRRGSISAVTALRPAVKGFSRTAVQSPLLY